MHSKTFIHQLHAILREPHLQEWICWSPDDDSVFILKPYDRQFSSLVLKRYFKHGNVSSFVRQLHMYGFHKLSNLPETSGENKKNYQARDKSSVKWYFTHPLGFFRKDSDAATLKRIQRKSTGVGKDGKRKNVLSTVCVNYIEPTSIDNGAQTTSSSDVNMSPQDIARLRQQQLSPLAPVPSHLQGSTQIPVQQTIVPHRSLQQQQPSELPELDASVIPFEDRKHYGSVPQLPVAATTYGQFKQPETLLHQSMLPHILRKDHLLKKPRTISSPEILQRSALQNNLSSLNSGYQGSLPCLPNATTPLQAFPTSHYPTSQYFPYSQYPSNRNQLTGPISTPSSIASSSATASYFSPSLDHKLETNILALQNSIIAIADMLPSISKDISHNQTSGENVNLERYIRTLQNLKADIITEHSWAPSRGSQSSFGGTTASSSISHQVVPSVGLALEESSASKNNISSNSSQKLGIDPSESLLNGENSGNDSTSISQTISSSFVTTPMPKK